MKAGMLGSLGAAQDGTRATSGRGKTRIRATKKLESNFINPKRIDFSWYPNRIE